LISSLRYTRGFRAASVRFAREPLLVDCDGEQIPKFLGCVEVENVKWGEDVRAAATLTERLDICLRGMIGWLAGPLAEMHSRVGSRWSWMGPMLFESYSADVGGAIELMDDFEIVESADREKISNQAYRYAQRLVEERWADINAVADALQACKRITPNDIPEIVARVPRVEGLLPTIPKARRPDAR
jgi:hypothetical protein